MVEEIADSDRHHALTLLKAECIEYIERIERIECHGFMECDVSLGCLGRNEFSECTEYVRCRECDGSVSRQGCGVAIPGWPDCMRCIVGQRCCSSGCLLVASCPFLTLLNHGYDACTVPALDRVPSRTTKRRWCRFTSRARVTICSRRCCRRPTFRRKRFAPSWRLSTPRIARTM